MSFSGWESGTEAGRAESSGAEAACGRRGRRRKRPEAGGESHFIRKMPESGDGGTIRTSESWREAVKADLGSPVSGNKQT